MFLASIFFVWQFVYIFKQSISVAQYHLSLSIFIPLSFLFIGLQKEKGIYNKSGFSKLILSIVIVILSFALAHSKTILLFTLLPLVKLNFLPIKSVNDTFLLLFIFTLLMYIIAFIVKKEMKLLAFLVSFLFCSVPFLSSKLFHETPLFLALGTGILGIRLIREAYEMAFIDTLTQIPSRRALDEYAQGLTPPYSLCMVDIDHFKKFNDTYGHDVGDEVLRYVAKELQKIKGGGKAFRYGGEEFTIIFANKLKFQVKQHLEQIRENIAQKGFKLKQKTTKNKTNDKSVNLTISLGVCDSEDAKYIYDMFILADKALYKAKEGGRNCLKMH